MAIGPCPATRSSRPPPSSGESTTSVSASIQKPASGSPRHRVPVRRDVSVLDAPGGLGVVGMEGERARADAVVLDGDRRLVRARSACPRACPAGRRAGTRRGRASPSTSSPLRPPRARRSRCAGSGTSPSSCMTSTGRALIERVVPSSTSTTSTAGSRVGSKSAARLSSAARVSASWAASVAPVPMTRTSSSITRWCQTRSRGTWPVAPGMTVSRPRTSAALSSPRTSREMSRGMPPTDVVSAVPS